jgi:hypothetical protein
VTHLYVLSPPVTGNYCVGVPGAPFLCGVVFTVTDAAGQSHSDTLLMVFLDQSPD